MRLFDLYAREYDRWYEKPFGSSVYALELECLRVLLKDVKRAIEVGVGSGRFASALGIPYGSDTSLELLRMAKRRGVRTALADAHNMPFKDKSFDTVLVVVSLCFFEEPSRALKEMARIITDGGRLVLGLILRESPWAEFYIEKEKKGHPLYSYAHFYSFDELKSMLKFVGFRLERVRTTLFEEPQDERRVSNTEIREGFDPTGGFFCVSCLNTPKTRKGLSRQDRTGVFQPL